MHVIHFNVRLSEGGAARIALDLHRGLLADGQASTFLYGYGRRLRDSPLDATEPKAERVAGKFGVLANYGMHWAIGQEFVRPKQAERILDAIRTADVIHLHATHSWYLPYRWLLRALLDGPHVPVVWTLHDHWLLTGRCAIAEGCEEWQNGCGRCHTKTNYPPALMDYSDRWAKEKRGLLNQLEDRLTLVSPSTFLAAKHRQIYPRIRIEHIPNGLDRETENIALAESESSREAPFKVARDPLRRRIIVVATDLSHRAKADPEVISALRDKVDFDLMTVGANSPFEGDNVQNLGPISERRYLSELLRSADALLFTSTVDNSPLVIPEALAMGTPVLAVDSPAAEEILTRVGGRPFKTAGEAALFLQNDGLGTLYDSANRQELSARALKAFSGELMTRRYLDLYSSLLDMQTAGNTVRDT